MDERHGEPETAPLDETAARQRFWPGERSAAMVARPTPDMVKMTAGVEGVKVARLVQALRDQTGSSRATAYRAIRDALASGKIRCGRKEERASS